MLLDVFVVEEKGEKLLVLFQAFEECIVNAIKVGELEVVLLVHECALLEFLVLQENLLDLHERLCLDTLIKITSGTIIEFGNNLGQFLLLILG